MMAENTTAPGSTCSRTNAFPAEGVVEGVEEMEGEDVREGVGVLEAVRVDDMVDVALMAPLNEEVGESDSDAVVLMVVVASVAVGLEGAVAAPVGDAVSEGSLVALPVGEKDAASERCEERVPQRDATGDPVSGEIVAVDEDVGDRDTRPLREALAHGEPLRENSALRDTDAQPLPRGEGLRDGAGGSVAVAPRVGAAVGAGGKVAVAPRVGIAGAVPYCDDEPPTVGTSVVVRDAVEAAESTGKDVAEGAPPEGDGGEEGVS
jgi:hypothetical protein